MSWRLVATAACMSAWCTTASAQQQPPPRQPPAEAPPPQKPPAQDPTQEPPDEPPAEEPPAPPPTEEPPIEPPPTEEPPVEPPTEEPPAKDPPPTQPPIGEPVPEQPPVGDPPAKQPPLKTAPTLQPDAQPDAPAAGATEPEARQDKIEQDKIEQDAAKQAAAQQARIDSSNLAPGLQALQGVGLPWNLWASWGQSLNLTALDRSSTHSYNPQYVWEFAVLPVYRFSQQLSVSVLQTATIELTDSDVDAQRQQFLLDDTQLAAEYIFLQATPAEKQTLMMSVLGALWFPLSLASRAASVVLTPQAGVRTMYINNNVLDGLFVFALVDYRRRLATANTVSVDGPGFPCAVSGRPASEQCFHLGGSATTRDLWRVNLDTRLLATSKTWIRLLVSLGWNHKYPLADATLGDDQILTGGETFEEMSLTPFRNSRVISLSVRHLLTDWLSITPAVTNTFADIGPDGKRRPPFKPIDTVVSLLLTMQVDQLYLSTQSTDDEVDAPR